jgi:hypothetical protein
MKALSTSINNIRNNRVKILGLLFFLLFFYFLYLAYQSISLNYLPVFSDEYGYYLDAKNFWLYNRIDAATTLNESYSLIGNAGFHGFMYNIFYGTLFKFFAFVGITPSIVAANLIMVFCLFIFIAISRISLEKKYLIGTLFLSNYIFVIYISSSMAEIFHYVFAVIAGYLLYLIYETREKRYLYSFVALIFFLIPFRESWVFAFFGLFFLSRSLKEFAKYSILLLVGLAVVILYQKYFQAAFTIDYFHNIKSQIAHQSLTDALRPIYEHFLTNVDKYFISETYDKYRFVYYYKYLFVIVLAYTLLDGLWTRDKAVLSSAVIATVFFTSLLVLYDPFGWREARTLAAPFIIMATVLILSQRYLAVFLIILFQLFTLNTVLDTKQRIDTDRKQMNVLIEKNRPLLDDFKEFGNYIGTIDKKVVTVLMNWDLMPVDNSPLFYQLPLSLNGKQIRYSFIYRHYDILDSISDIYISSRVESASNMELIGKNKNFYFYRRIK